MVDWKFCHVNKNYLPIKLHYFFFYGGIAGADAFMPLVAKRIGINATASGIIFTITSFIILFSKPIFGYITDFFHNIKAVVILLVSVTSLSYFLAIFIPPINETKWLRVKINCEGFDNTASLIASQYDISCVRELLTTELEGELSFVPCNSNTSINFNGKVGLENDNNKHFFSSIGSNEGVRFKFTPKSNFSCICIKSNSSFFSCPSLNSCFLEKEISSVYSVYQFWVFMFLAVISGTGCVTVFCLSDTACYEVLGDDLHLYGRQILWATISWTLVSITAGFLNDCATRNSNSNDYSPGFYLMMAMLSIDILLLFNISLTKSNFSLNICKDIGIVFSSFEAIAFAFFASVIGCLSGLLSNYELWFLEDLGASPFLLGLDVALESFVNVPCFFFSGWIIRKLGHFYCILATIGAYFFRFVVYYFLQNPWYVLSIDVIDGVTYSIFIATLTSYAFDIAPAGSEATMMGILAGLFEGLGAATGSFLGGIGFDKLGGRQTFLIAAGVSLFSMATLLLVLFAIKKHPPKTELQYTHIREHSGTREDDI